MTLVACTAVHRIHRSDQTSHASTPAGEEDCDRHDASRGGWRHHHPHQNTPNRSTVRSGPRPLLWPPSAGTWRTVHRRTCTPSCSGNLLFAEAPGSLQPDGGRSRTTRIRRALIYHGAPATAPTTPKQTCTTSTVTRVRVTTTTQGPRRAPPCGLQPSRAPPCGLQPSPLHEPAFWQHRLALQQRRPDCKHCRLRVAQMRVKVIEREVCTKHTGKKHAASAPLST